MLHAKFRYADHAHARILRIDTAAARALPGVLAVVTARRRAGRALRAVWSRTAALFARDVVRFEGEVVAAVAATTAEIAEQAAALIEVDYEPLPVVIDFEAALADGAPLVHDGWAGYGALEDIGPGRQRRLLTRRSSRATSSAALAEADVVVRERYVADMSQRRRSSRARSSRSGRATR